MKRLSLIGTISVVLIIVSIRDVLALCRELLRRG